LSLTPEQRKSRAKVPLPYAHKGMCLDQKNRQLWLTWSLLGDFVKDAPQLSGAILYDPDSADDIDDDDPDEDLDI
jgi:elongator complex protein 5